MIVWTLDLTMTILEVLWETPFCLLTQPHMAYDYVGRQKDFSPPQLWPRTWYSIHRSFFEPALLLHVMLLYSELHLLHYWKLCSSSLSANLCCCWVDVSLFDEHLISFTLNYAALCFPSEILIKTCQIYSPLEKTGLLARLTLAPSQGQHSHIWHDQGVPTCSLFPVEI